MFNFPWSNFHELNLDWILSVVKEAKEIFVKGEGDIQHAVETADQALETAEQAAAGVIADGAVTIPKINSEVFSLLAYCVSGSVAPNFIPAGALVILRKSTIYNVTDGIYTATRNIPQAAIITAADLDQNATLYREGGMNYLLHNEEKLSGTIDLIKAGLVILVTGDDASAAIPADGLAYVTSNTHGLTEGFYFNSSGATFPPTGGTADSDSFTAVNNILNALQTAVATLGSDDIANDSTVTGASVTDALDAVKNTLTQQGNTLTQQGNTLTQQESTLIAVKSDLGIVEDTNTATHTIAKGQYVIWNDSLYKALADIPIGTTLTNGNLLAIGNGGLNALISQDGGTILDNFSGGLTGGLLTWRRIGQVVVVELRAASSAGLFENVVVASGLPRNILDGQFVGVGLWGNVASQCQINVNNNGQVVMNVNGAYTSSIFISYVYITTDY